MRNVLKFTELVILAVSQAPRLGPWLTLELTLLGTPKAPIC